MRTQQRALSQCHFFGDESFFGLFLVFSFELVAPVACVFVCCGGLLVIGFSVENVLDALFWVCLCLFLMESLILAQDERWRWQRDRKSVV